MDRNAAEKLVLELKKHPRIFNTTKEFVGILVSAGIKDSSRFYEEVPQMTQSLDEYGRSYQFSIRRILRNKNAVLAPVSDLKLIWRKIASRAGIYDSDVFARDLRESEEIVDMMFTSLKEGHDFSLLGKLDECNYEAPPTKYKSSPILVIPGMMESEESLARILKWEDANTTRDKDGKIFGYTF